MKIGIVQICSLLDYRANLEKISNFLKQAKDQQVKAVFLPECFYSMSDGTKPTPYLVKEGNEHFKNIQDLAKKYAIALLGGSVAWEKEGQVINRNLNFDAQGNLIGHYDKVHLFSCNLQKGSEKKVINEADIYTPGKDYSVLKFEDLTIGLGICFDLRFSEQAHNYRTQGANVLTFSSAFTVPTGKAHWHILNRARAIENQCFVVASAQWGRHNERIQTFGHSLVVDPWGEVLVDAEEGEKLVTVELDLTQVENVRKKVNM